MAKVIQVIETSEKRGKGTKDDVVRMVYQLWTLDGKLIVEHDPILEIQKKEKENSKKKK